VKQVHITLTPAEARFLEATLIDAYNYTEACSEPSAALEERTKELLVIIRSALDAAET